MDAALLLILTAASMLAWVVAIFDPTTPRLYRVLGIFFGMPVLVWYAVFIIGATKSPVWNGLSGGPFTIAALALGAIAFLAREKKQKPPPVDGLAA